MTRKSQFLLGALFLSFGCCQMDLGRGDLRAPAPTPAPPEADPPATAARGAAAVDLVPRTLARIPVGTVVGREAPKGWSHLVLFATPTLSAGDLRDAPKMSADYARMFKFTLLADVRRAGDGPSAPYVLHTVARGFALTVRGQETVVSGSDTRGADLGMFGTRILAENERILDQDVLQVARTSGMLVFDAQSMMRVGTDHVRRVMRHAVVTDPGTGKLATFVWLLTDDGRGGYVAAEPALQRLPDNCLEARLLSVKRDRFTLGIPRPDAFALVRIPQGTAIAWTPQLKGTATVKKLTAEQVQELEQALRGTAFAAAR